MTGRRQKLLALLGGAALAVGACTGGSAGPTSAPSATGASSGSASPTAAPGATESASVTVGIASSATLGTYLTGPDGRTLYVFAKDGANTSACTTQCLKNWPALTVPAGASVVAGTGVTGALATFARPDGTLQVSYVGHPLYYFIGDKKPGDTNGQGVAGLWTVAPVSGSVPAASPTSAGYNY